MVDRPTLEDGGHKWEGGKGWENEKEARGGERG